MSIIKNKVKQISNKSILKKLLLTSPHKDLKIPIIRLTETGRELQGWDI